MGVQTGLLLSLGPVNSTLDLQGLRDLFASVLTSLCFLMEWLTFQSSHTQLTIPSVSLKQSFLVGLHPVIGSPASMLTGIFLPS